MKVYVITRGEYSDYGICGVTLDKEKAEIIREFVSTKWQEGRIEEWDTDEYSDVSAGEHYYEVILDKDDTVAVYSEDGWAYDRNHGVKECYNGNMQMYVTARDEEHAKKIALDRFAKYKYRKAMGE